MRLSCALKNREPRSGVCEQVYTHYYRCSTKRTPPEQFKPRRKRQRDAEEGDDGLTCRESDYINHHRDGVGHLTEAERKNKKRRYFLAE